MSAAAAQLLDVGNCDPDHAAISRMLNEHFHVTIDRVMYVDQAMDRMRRRRYDLVLFNRLIFEDGSEGIELLKRAGQDASLRDVPIMMVSNFPEAQEAARRLGGRPGFGKAAIDQPGTIEMLSAYLPRK